ncbi:mCG1030490, isoform CRA_a, partial [Mus musculus]
KRKFPRHGWLSQPLSFLASMRRAALTKCTTQLKERIHLWPWPVLNMKCDVLKLWQSKKQPKKRTIGVHGCKPGGATSTSAVMLAAQAGYLCSRTRPKSEQREPLAHLRIKRRDNKEG